MITFINLLIIFIIHLLFLLPATNKKRLNNISILASLSADFKNIPFLFPLTLLWVTLGSSVIYEFTVLIEILFIIVSIIIIYEKFYNEKNLEKTLSSFLSFFLFMVLLILYIYSLRWFYADITSPIFIDNLHYSAYYRYSFMLIFSLIGFFIYYQYYDIFRILTFPYIKEEVRKIMDLYKRPIWGPLCNFILEKCKNKKLLFLGLFLHFICFIFLRIVISILFINFVFFKGDLRPIIYIAPLIFIVWILSFVEYYFDIFFIGSKEYINSLLIVVPIKKLNKPFSGAILTTGNDFSFSLTPLALQKNYDRVDILANIWLDLGKFDFFYSLYKKMIRYISIVLLSLQLLCWIFLSYHFFFHESLGAFLLVNPALTRNSIFPSRLLRGMFRATTPLYYSEGYSIDRTYQRILEKESGGTFKENHLAIVDLNVRNPDNPTEVLFEGTLTSGPGSSKNPSYPLSTSKNITGQPKHQNFVPPSKNPEYIPTNYLKNLVLNSKEYFESNEVKSNLAKWTPPRSEDT